MTRPVTKPNEEPLITLLNRHKSKWTPNDLHTHRQHTSQSSSTKFLFAENGKRYRDLQLVKVQRKEPEQRLIPNQYFYAFLPKFKDHCEEGAERFLQSEVEDDRQEEVFFWHARAAVHMDSQQ